MLINYGGYPILNIFNKGIDGHIKIADEDKYILKDRDFLTSILNEASAVNQKFYVVSKTFAEAVELASPKLDDLFVDRSTLRAKIDVDVNGVYLLNDFVVFEKFSIAEGELNAKFTTIVFHRKGILIACNVNDVIWGSLNIFQNEKQVTDFILKMSNFCIYVDLFKKHAEVETIEIPPNKKVHIDNFKTKNETNIPAFYLDSKWFRNIVRNEGFMVRGHLRFQPHKNEKGEWTKKLIWIKDFTKHGYHSKARILNQGGNNNNETN